MGATATIAAVAGGGLQAFGQLRSGQYQRAGAYQQAGILEAQANDAVRRGTVRAGRVRMGTRMLIGEQRANLGGQGIALDSGSAVELQADAAKWGEIDALTEIENAAREAWANRTQAQNLQFQGDVAAKSGRQQALGTILGTGGNVLAMKYGFAGKTPKAGAEPYFP